MPTVQRQSWPKFLQSFDWRQGEYVTIIGPKGYGKTTVLLELARRRQYIVILANKVRDRTLSSFIERNKFTKISSWDKRPLNKYKIVLWPPFEGINSFKTQETVFRNAINGTENDTGIFQQGNWTVALDEMLYLTGADGIGLDEEIKMLYTQGRSNGLSILAGSQRPRGIPQHMLNQADHYIYFQVVDEYELHRMSEVVGNLALEVRRIVPNLQKYEFMYINKQERYYTISKVAQ